MSIALKEKHDSPHNHLQTLKLPSMFFGASLLLLIVAQTCAGDDGDVMRDALAALHQHLKASEGHPPLLHEHHPQGIVTTAGSASQLTMAYVGLRMLREFCGSTLPVELAYVGSDNPERAILSLIKVSNLMPFRWMLTALTCLKHAGAYSRCPVCES